jgi:DNA-binding NarL/FixJ family response regulator
MRLLLVDDDAHVRSALRLLLEDEPGVTVVGEYSTADGLIDTIVQTRACVVLLDWDLPGLTEPPTLDHLLELQPDVCLVALSGRPEGAVEARKMGIPYFVCKGDAPENLMDALRALQAEPLHSCR